MSQIAFRRCHALGRDGLRQRLAKLEAKLRERYGVSLAWAGDHADVRGPGVTGRITLAEEAVDVELKLGLMLRPMATQIREAMERQVDRALG